MYSDVVFLTAVNLRMIMCTCVCVCVLHGFRVEFWLGLSSVRLAASQNTRHFIKVQTAFEWSDAHGTVYLDLDLSIAFRSLSMSSFLLSRDLLSCRFSSPSSSDLISELTDEVLWPCRPPERAGEQKHSVIEEHLLRKTPPSPCFYTHNHPFYHSDHLNITHTVKVKMPHTWISMTVSSCHFRVISVSENMRTIEYIYIYMYTFHLFLRSREWRWEDE